MMTQTPLVLVHWEAFYPYPSLETSLQQTSQAKDFPLHTLRIALPYTYLQQATGNFPENNLVFGANHILESSTDSFTGSIAGKALKEARAGFVLIGKASERHSQSSSAINSRIQQALKHEIPLFFCFGESTEEAEAGRTGEVILSQLKAAFEGISPEDLTNVHFVYDTPHALLERSDIQQQHLDPLFELCREQYTSLWGEDIASSLKTLCALPAYMPISDVFFTSSPFAGLYFKMVSADLEWLLKTWPKKDLATKIEELPLSPIDIAAQMEDLESVSEEEKKEEDEEKEEAPPAAADDTEPSPKKRKPRKKPSESDEEEVT